MDSLILIHSRFQRLFKTLFILAEVGVHSISPYKPDQSGRIARHFDVFTIIHSDSDSFSKHSLREAKTEKRLSANQPIRKCPYAILTNVK